MLSAGLITAGPGCDELEQYAGPHAPDVPYAKFYRELYYHYECDKKKIN